MSGLPVPESMAAYDALVQAYITWRGDEAAFDGGPSTVRAALADLAWLQVVIHAENCGCALREPDVLSWVRRRVVAYARMLGVEAAAEAVLS